METMSVREAAVFLKCSPKTVERRMDEHVYPYVVENGHRILIKEDLEGILLSKRIPAVAEVEAVISARRKRA